MKIDIKRIWLLTVLSLIGASVYGAQKEYESTEDKKPKRLPFVMYDGKGTIEQLLVMLKHSKTEVYGPTNKILIVSSEVRRFFSDLEAILDGALSCKVAYALSCSAIIDEIFDNGNSALLGFLLAAGAAWD